MYLLKEKLGSLSGDDFTVVNPNNSALGFKLDSSTLSMRGSRKLKELHGHHVILHMKHQVRPSLGSPLVQGACPVLETLTVARPAHLGSCRHRDACCSTKMLCIAPQAQPMLLGHAVLPEPEADVGSGAGHEQQVVAHVPGLDR